MKTHIVAISVRQIHHARYCTYVRIGRLIKIGRVYCTACSFKWLIDRCRVNPTPERVYVTKISWKSEMVRACFNCAAGTAVNIVSMSYFVYRVTSFNPRYSFSAFILELRVLKITSTILAINLPRELCSVRLKPARYRISMKQLETINLPC